MKKPCSKVERYEDGLLVRLRQPEYASEYLNVLLSDSSPEGEKHFLAGLRDVARAYGFSDLAKVASLGRESLYKALSKRGNPKLQTLMTVLNAVGLKLSIEPMKKDKVG